MIHPNDIRLFLEVVDAGSFSRVAAQRRTVQSHISRQVSALEQACGAPLFRRTGRGVVLTDFGEYVEKQVRGWLRSSDELFDTIRHTSAVPMGEVRIGALPSAAHPLLTHLFQQLDSRYPAIKLNVREGQGDELDALLDIGSVDMAILFRYQAPTGSDETWLATANTYLVSSPDCPPTQEETMDFRQLKGLPLVLPRRPAHWRAILDETARSQGFTLQPVIEADSLRLQKEAVATSRRVHAVLGPFAIDDEIRSGRLRATRIINPNLKRYVTLALPKQGNLTQAGKVVAKMIEETVRGWNHDLSPL